jgi:peptidoglycan/LPS O-acetylase OafA/YrhL
LEPNADVTLKARLGRRKGDSVRNGTLTNIFWGLFLIWFGVVAAWLKGDFGATINHPYFAIGTGILLLALNLFRSFLRLKLSVLTIALGALLTIANISVIELRLTVPFLPELLMIAGVALVIGAFRTRNYQTF